MQKERVLDAFQLITSRILRKSFSCKSAGLILLLVALGFWPCGCAMLGEESKPEGAVLIDSVRRGSPPDLQKTPVSMNISELRKAQGNADLNQLRIIKIVLSASQSGDDPLPQYRIFDVKPGSVAQVLGIQNADVLVAANGYVVYHPQQFMRYLASLPIKDGTFIEIRRDGKPILFEYSFVGVDPRTNERVQIGARQSSDAKAVDNAAAETMKKEMPEETPSAEPASLPVLNEKDASKMAAATPTPKALKSPTPTPKKTSESSKKKSQKSKKKTKTKKSN